MNRRAFLKIVGVATVFPLSYSHTAETPMLGSTAYTHEFSAEEFIKAMDLLQSLGDDLDILHPALQRKL